MTTPTETQAMCERVVAMVTRREKFARTMHQSIYADDLASVLALLTRQQKEIDARDAKIAELMEAAKGSLAIVNIAKKELRHVRSVLRNQTCLFGSVMRTFSPDPQEEYRGLTDFEIAVSPAVRAALQAKP